MSKPKSTSAAQKKKRLAQLRDAQRRRRERLKGDSKHFVQIILPKNVLVRLQNIILETGETMQQAIGRLVESCLPPMAALPVESVANTWDYPEAAQGEVFPETSDSLASPEIAMEESASDQADFERTPVEALEVAAETPDEADQADQADQADHVDKSADVEAVPTRHGQLDLFG